MAKSKKVQSRAPNASRPHMPGYGLPKGTKGLLPWGWAEQRLKKSQLLDHHRKAGWVSAHHDLLGALAR